MRALPVLFFQNACGWSCPAGLGSALAIRIIVHPPGRSPAVPVSLPSRDRCHTGCVVRRPATKDRSDSLRHPLALLAGAAPPCRTSRQVLSTQLRTGFSSTGSLAVQTEEHPGFTQPCGPAVQHASRAKPAKSRFRIAFPISAPAFRCGRSSACGIRASPGTFRQSSTLASTASSSHRPQFGNRDTSSTHLVCTTCPTFPLFRPQR